MPTILSRNGHYSQPKDGLTMAIVPYEAPVVSYLRGQGAMTEEALGVNSTNENEEERFSQLISSFSQLKLNVLYLIARHPDIELKMIIAKLGVAYFKADKEVKALESDGLVTHSQTDSKVRGGGRPKYLYRLADSVPANLAEELAQAADLFPEKNLEEVAPEAQSEEADPEAQSSKESKVLDWKEILRQHLPNSSESFIDSHIPIVALVRQREFAGMNFFSTKLGKRPNYIHVRLQNLLDSKLFEREKRPAGTSPSGRRVTEYVYFFSPRLPDSTFESLGVEAAQQHLEHEIQQTNFTGEGDSSDLAKVFGVMATESTQSAVSERSEVSERLVLAKLPKLPEYDPSWPEGIKADWFRAYRQLLAMGREDS